MVRAPAYYGATLCNGRDTPPAWVHELDVASTQEAACLMPTRIICVTRADLRVARTLRAPRAIDLVWLVWV